MGRPEVDVSLRGTTDGHTTTSPRGTGHDGPSGGTAWPPVVTRTPSRRSGQPRRASATDTVPTRSGPRRARPTTASEPSDETPAS